MNRNHGFTLIEAMIVMAIVGILAAIAIPSYQSHLRKGYRATAQAFMMEIVNRQNQYLLDARNYAVGSAALTTLNVSTPADVSKYYAVTITPAAPATPPAFTIVATPVTGAGQDADGVLTLDNSGAKTRNSQPGW